MINGKYFNNKNLSGSPVLVRDDANINFNWGSGSPGYLWTSVPVSSLTVWTGTVPGTGGPGPTGWVVYCNYLNVHTVPGVTYIVIKAVPAGTIVPLLNRNAASSWAKVQLANGTVDWMSATQFQEHRPQTWRKSNMKRLAVAVHISFYLLWLMSCSRGPLTTTATNATLEPTSSPQLIWDNSPNTRIVLSTLCCDSPTTEELVRFYIPESQLWGDGRFLWVTQDENGGRQVFVKQMSTNEIARMLQEIDASGFFDWDPQYIEEPVTDAASHCLTVTLTDRDKTVCATGNDAPDDFYTLFAWLSQGAGTSGTPYWPETAYLTGFQLEDTGVPLPEPDLTWPEHLVRVPVETAIKGFWLDEGEAVQLLWDAANRNPYHMPVVEGEGGRYRIILQVPGVSWIEPR